MPYLSVPLALEVEVALAGFPVVDDAVVVFAAAAVLTGPVPGVAVPPMGAVYWPLISSWIVELNWPDMWVKLRVPSKSSQWGSSKTREKADVRELGGERESGILRGLGVLETKGLDADETRDTCERAQKGTRGVEETHYSLLSGPMVGWGINTKVGKFATFVLA